MYPNFRTSWDLTPAAPLLANKVAPVTAYDILGATYQATYFKGPVAERVGLRTISRADALAGALHGIERTVGSAGYVDYAFINASSVRTVLRIALTVA